MAGLARRVGLDVARLVRPPRRVSVRESAEQSLRVVDGNGTAHEYNADQTPYMVDPMNAMASRHYDAVIFVGPARTGKTLSLIDGFVCYIVTCDPGDALIVQISEEKAREYSRKRLQRMFRASADMRAEISPRGHDNNVHDRIFKSGNYLGIKWPTVNVLSSSDYRYVVLTDYDRMPADIGGEGDAFSLAKKRTQTFGSSGMCAVESSPGRAVQDPEWRAPAGEPHMMPPAPGIASLFNLGTRHRWYWQCGECTGWYRPEIGNWIAENARPVCPHCGSQPRQADKRQLNLGGRWVPEGCELDADGNLLGEPRQSRIASFAIEGPAAAYQQWEELQYKLDAAEESYQATGSEELLKSATGLDWGRPYTPRTTGTARSADRLADRAETVGQRRVPHGVRFLTAAVDVQAGSNARWVVQIIGWGESRECWIVDRFNIRFDRGADGEQEERPLDPASRPDDWQVLTRDLLPRQYELDDDSGRQMSIARIVVDTGGAEGVQANALQWYRSLRRSGDAGRVILVKGSNGKQQQLIRETYPDSTKRRNRDGGSRGDVPVQQLGTDGLKDQAAALLDRPEPGPGYLHIPDWVGRFVFDELASEERGSDGRWRQVKSRPNEAFDCLVYALVAWIKLGADKIDWSAPPAWAQPWDTNSWITAPGESAEAIQGTRRKRRKRKPRTHDGFWG